jgi:hypothetical protein
LSPALVASDVLEVFSFIAFSVANTYTQSQVDGLLDSYVGLRLITPTSVTGGTIGSTGAVTFTTASSVALNGVFSSAYDNYRIVISGNMAGTALIQFRFRTGTTDDTGSNYSYAEFVSDGSASYPATATAQNIGRFAGFVAVRSAATVDVFSPFETKTTGLITVGVRSFTNPNQYNFYSGVNTTTSYDGINLIAQSGTMTGTVRVYGYKN